MLELTNISKRYDNGGDEVLKDVSLRIEPGQTVSIVGPSGSGKSLLLRAIADLDPHDGEAWVGAQARSGMTPPEWRRRVGLLPAEASWWADTVGEHFPPPRDGDGPPVSALTGLG